MRVVQHNCNRMKEAVEMALATALERGAEVVIIQEPPPERMNKNKKNKNKKSKAEEEEEIRFQMRHPGYHIYRGRRAWTAVKRDLEGWVVERRTDLESGGEGDVVVMDFIPLIHVNKRASAVEGRHEEEETEEKAEGCEESGGRGRLRLGREEDTEEEAEGCEESGGRGRLRLGREEDTEEEAEECEGSGGPGRLRLVNVYDAPAQQRPARNLDWEGIMGPRTILAGDFNAHSPMWNPIMLPSKRTPSAGFLEALIVTGMPGHGKSKFKGRVRIGGAGSPGATL
jgi:hypothetical protein